MVKMIRVLLKVGVPLKTICDLKGGRTPEMILKLLNHQKDVVTSDIRFLQEIYEIISTFADLIHEGISADEVDISVTEMPDRHIILGEPTDFNGDKSFIREFLHFYDGTPEKKINPSFPVGGYWNNMNDFLVCPSRPMRFFSVDPNGNDKKAAGIYMTGYTRGYYGNTNGLPLRMKEFAKENHLTFNGPVYNIYLFDEVSETDPERYLLQVSVPVMEQNRKSSPHLIPHFSNIHN